MVDNATVLRSGRGAVRLGRRTLQKRFRRLRAARSELHFADLDGGLRVGEMRKVGNDLRKNGAETLLKGFEGVEVEMADGEVGRGSIGHHAGNAMVDRGLAKSGADELVDERDVFFAIVSDVEMISRLIGIEDANLDHGASWGAKGENGVLMSRLDNGERGRSRGRETESGKWICEIRF